jgi:PAS domain S-box-containing protein
MRKISLSLRSVITLAVVVGLLLPLLFTGWQTVLQQRTIQTANLISEQQTLTAFLANSVSQAVWDLNASNIRGLVEPATLDQRVVRVTVIATSLDAKPTVLFDFYRPERHQAQLLVATRNMEWKNQQLGTVRLEMDTGPMEARLRQEFKRALMTAAAQLVLSLTLILLILNYRFILPLKRLLMQSSYLANRRLDFSFNWKRRDELGELGNSLEATRQSLQVAFMEVRESEQRFRSLTNLSSDWYWERDANWRVVSTSEGAQEGADGVIRFANKDEELFNLRFPQGEHWARCQLKIAAHEPFRDMEWYAEHRDGKMRYGTISGEPIFDEAGRFRGYRGIGKNLTTAKTAELLEKTNRELQLAMQDLQQAQSQLIQSEKMAALGQLVAGVAHEINTPLAAVKSSGKNIADSLNTALNGLPRLFQQLDQQAVALFVQMIGGAHVDALILSTREERNAILKAVAILEQENIEDARHKASILVQLRAHTKLAEYMPLLKHPQCEMILETSYSFGTIASNTANINTAAERVAKIVFALKSFSRVGHTGEISVVDLREGIESVLVIYQNQIKQHTELIRRYEDLPPIRCMPDELNQVWTNLIHNALQAMSGAGTLTIGIRKIGEEALVTIGDTGCGIPDDIRERIFDPFFTTKPVGEGTGLGLDIVKKIVDKHAGRIEVKSKVGIGTIFYIYLPY